MSTHKKSKHALSWPEKNPQDPGTIIIKPHHRLRDTKKSHSWKHAGTYQPFNRPVVVDVFICTECPLHPESEMFIKGQRKESCRESPSENIIFPDDPKFVLDWKVKTYEI